MRSHAHRLNGWLKRHSLVRTAIIFILALLCAFELDAIVRGFRDTRASEELPVRYRDGEYARERRITTPDEIEPWMTFQYINFAFQLPKDYLSYALEIGDDSHYPNIQIVRYARMQDLELAAFLESVRDAVTSYTPQTY